MNLPGDGPDDWQPTDHDRVYYGPHSMPFRRGEYRYAKAVARFFPEWTVLISIGPYRDHDIAYDLHPDDGVIHLDCYSVAMTVNGPDFPHRPRHPVDEHGAEIIEAIDQDIQQLQRRSEAEAGADEDADA